MELIPLSCPIYKPELRLIKKSTTTVYTCIAAGGKGALEYKQLDALGGGQLPCAHHNRADGQKP